MHVKTIAYPLWNIRAVHPDHLIVTSTNNNSVTSTEAERTIGQYISNYVLTHYMSICIIFFMNIFKYDKITSTNDYLKRDYDKYPNNVVIVAKKQTAGKGRKGRTFVSPDGGLYFSILLKGIGTDKIPFITPMAAIAVVRALSKRISKRLAVKWVNDVYADGKKLCGILCEGKFSENTPEYVVVGIGLNVFIPCSGFDKEIEKNATSVFDEYYIDKIEFNDRIDSLRDEILSEFFELYKDFDPCLINKLYRNYAMLVGKRVVIEDGENKYFGKVIGFNDKCNIVLETEFGERELSSGTLISVE